VRHSSRLENGPEVRLPPSSIAYQPGLTPRMSDLSSLTYWGAVIVALHYGIRAERSSIWSVFVPADGTSAAN
jgi:hypothetical protein